MLALVTTTQFRKDLKRLRKTPPDRFPHRFAL